MIVHNSSDFHACMKPEVFMFYAHSFECLCVSLNDLSKLYLADFTN